ncbi:MAG TPA: AAA family ATPase [Pirellulaceae bacterium]|nr:AAA family ATPase [Pirellulaceae bacterium]
MKRTSKPHAGPHQRKARPAKLPDLDDPPHDLDSERRVLAALLIDPKLALSAVDLTPADFFDPAHAMVFRTIKALAAEGATPEAPLILERLNRLPIDAAQRLGKPPAALLAEVVKAECTAANVRFYADFVREKAIARQQQAAALATLTAIQRGELAVCKPNGVPVSVFDPVVVNLGTVAPRPVQWLWLNRIPLGKLTLIAGEPGLGKSFLTMDLAARVTRGSTWPDNLLTQAPIGSVVLLSAEDDIADTIRPRLDAAGADVSKIVALQGVEFHNRELGRPLHRTFSLETDLLALEKAIADLSDCRLVIIDPVSAYLGGKDSHKNAEIRGLLTPLAELAGRYGVAVVAVTHLNKCAGQKALHRFTGSLAFVAAARAGWLVAEDKDDPKRRLLLPVKNNLAAEVTGLAYSIVDGAVAWERNPVTVSADDAIAEDPQREGASERDEAAAWLTDLLADGPLPQKDVQAAAKDNGYSWATVRRAKERLGVASRREGFGKGSKVLWELPAHTCSTAPYALNPADMSTYAEREHLRGEPAGVQRPHEDSDPRGETSDGGVF